MNQKKSKKKHNKKRNTAFLYEVLLRELTKSVVKEDKDRKKKVISIIREHFKKGTCLAREVGLYNTLCETKDLDLHTAEKLLYETKIEFMKIDQQDVFDEQSQLIKKMNKELSQDVFKNYVPNYKDLATLSQIFNVEMSVKKRVLLEKNIVDKLIKKEKEEEASKSPVDSVVYKQFIKKYNSEYSSLFLEQKEVINRYLMSFSDNSLSLKVYLNEELGRLREKVTESLELEEVRQDDDMVGKVHKTIEVLDSFKEQPIAEASLKKVLKIQSYVKETEK